MSESLNDANLTSMERGLALFILRSFDVLNLEIVSWCLGEDATDNRLTSALESVNVNSDIEDELSSSLDAIDLALTQNFMRGLGVFLFALETGDADMVNVSQEELNIGLNVCEWLNLVPQWWCFRITIHIIDDLWSSSFHAVLPPAPPDGDVDAWQTSRRLYIALLIKRKRSEIELWPSQIKAVGRAIDVHDNLVVSLPTSAGKTRIAELCILRCLSKNKRVVFVTPLRALSAQTEVSLQCTFGPLGYSVSTLYGSIGASRIDEDTLKERDIVVATPEKLDFALRSDPSLIDDVGLIILDECHMIGLGEREVRYEVQIQRLLKRADADQRRIVCLSASLPEGEKLDDFVNWIRRDERGSAVTSKWRPTKIRFGEIIWQTNRARLEFRIGEERSFIPNFFSTKQPSIGKRKDNFPRNHRELILATTWRLIADGQSVIIYCPQRKSVELFAREIANLHKNGLLDSVFDDNPSVLEEALSIGREWLGEDHPIIYCLKLGVAIHHGVLPAPFRKKMEKLLRDGILKITVSSSTLSQGLNLTATAVIMHSLFRNGKLIPASEFRNVIGRAGRAFIDLEGLVLFPIFKRDARKLAKWQTLTENDVTLEIESGIFHLVFKLIKRLKESLGKSSYEELLEYVLNNTTTWNFPELENEDEDQRGQALRKWSQDLSTLDTAILSLLGDQDIPSEEVAATLDEVLASSLWARLLYRQDEDIQALLSNTLKSRARLIWSVSSSLQRKGYFLAGIGLSSGQQLDDIAPIANELLVQGNEAILEGDTERAIEAITTIAEKLFDIPPFVPEPLPDNWRLVLRLWLEGASISEIGETQITDVLQFVNNGLAYRLPWGMEAVRVRAIANADVIKGKLIDEAELRLVVPAVETGSLNRQATILMQAGFSSRLAAIKAVTDTNAGFTTKSGFIRWLKSDLVTENTKNDNWPTPETTSTWLSFLQEYTPHEKSTWSIKCAVRMARWEDKVQVPSEGEKLRVHRGNDGTSFLLSANYNVLGSLNSSITQDWSGLLLGCVESGNNNILLTYYGPEDIDLE